MELSDPQAARGRAGSRPVAPCHQMDGLRCSLCVQLDFDPKIGATHSASTNFKALVPSLLPNVPRDCRADVAVQVWLLRGHLG